MEEFDKEIVEELEKNMNGMVTLLDKWDTFVSTDKMNNLATLMRYAHSMKSVASFMGNTEIQSEAHALEEKIIGIEKPEDFSGTFPKEISEHLNQIKEFINSSFDFSLSPEEEKKDSDQSGRKAQDVFSSLSMVTSSLEKSLLERAFRRGEQLYRLECRLDRSEALPYARAYLINRNLEEAATVLRTSPSLKNKSVDFSRFILIFTTDLKESEIKKELQIDSVEKISLERLDIADYNPEEWFNVKDDSQKGLKSEESESVFVSIDKLHDIEVNLEEIVSLNEQIELSEPIQYRKISNALDNLTKIVSGIVSTDLRTVLTDWHRFVSDVGNRLSKNVTLDLHCGSIGISKNRSLLIESCLRQLVHNSVSHGIESPSVREQAGKPAQAVIKISCRAERGNLVIEYSDDGTGIDEPKLRERGAAKGIVSPESTIPLLKLLALPGLSSKDNADFISGRGTGMDIVLSTVRDSLGGHILLENKEGQGVSFLISLPLKDTHYDVLIFQSGDHFFSLPKENIETTFSLDANNVEEEEKGRFFYWVDDQKLAIYEENSRISSDPLLHKFGIVVRNGFHRGVVVADDLVMEKRLDSARFTKCEKEESYLYDVKDGENSFGYKFLSPLMIQR